MDTSIPMYGCGPCFGNSGIISFLISFRVSDKEEFPGQRNFDPSNTSIVDDDGGEDE